VPIVLPSEADIAAVVALAPGNFARLIRFAQYTGMREEECASLEAGQIDRRRKAVTLTRTKTDRPRTVTLDDRALETLPVASAGTVVPLRAKWVFWHGGGERYLNVASRFAAIRARAEAAAKEAGKPFRRFRFHDLRHWFAVDYLRRGGSIYDLQKELGHASIKTTEIYLAHLTPDEQRSAKGPAQNPARV
jgi:integrase/recombinase XerD